MSFTSNSKIRVLYVGFFTQQGAMADDYVLLGKYLAERCLLYCLIGQSDINYDIPGVIDTLKLTFNRYNKTALFDMRNYIRVIKFVKEHRIDVVFFKTPNPANIIVSFLLRKYLQVMYCHDFKAHSGVNKFQALMAWIEQWLQAHNVKKAFVASQVLKLQMIQNGSYWKEEKVEVIPLGVMENLICDSQIAEEDIDVLFFGRVEYYKGLDILSKSVAGETWNVYVVGKGNLEKAYGSLKFPSNVTFINEYVEDIVLSTLIKRSKVVVLPYRDATGSQVIPTAMYCGKTIIASDVGSFGEYIQNGVNGIIIPPGDSKALNAAIADALGNEKLRERLCKNAAKKAQMEYSNSKISDMYICEFKELLESFKCEGA